MKSHHYSRFIRLIATGVLLIGNINLATPVLADSSIENQVTNKNGQTPSPTMSGNSQVATDQANTTQSEEIYTTNHQLRETTQQVNAQVSQEVSNQQVKLLKM